MSLASGNCAGGFACGSSLNADNMGNCSDNMSFSSMCNADDPGRICSRSMSQSSFFFVKSLAIRFMVRAVFKKSHTLKSTKQSLTERFQMETERCGPLSTCSGTNSEKTTGSAARTSAGRGGIGGM